MASSAKVALITGGSKGIGAATARLLRSQGWTIVVTYSSDAGAADKLVQELGAETALAIKSDAGKVADIEPVLDQILKKYGRLDAVVASAGVLTDKMPHDVTEEDWDRTMNLNTKGVFFLVQKAFPHMKPGGRVILFSSSQTVQTTVTPNYLLYCASKGAIEQMVHGFAKDLGSKGITCNVVSPGPTDTDMFRRGKSEELIKTMESWNPQKRLGQPSEVAALIGFLVSEEAQWVNGQNIRANGGTA